MAGDRGARGVQGRARLQIGSRARREERTRNMLPMFVTLEVSKLSGWLNAYAFCRESKGGHMRCGASRGLGGGREAQQTTASQTTCRGGLRPQIRGRARGGAHREHVAHGCDVGGVEAQRLVERLRVLPRVERRACGAGRGIRVGGSRRWTTAGHAARREGAAADWGAGHGEERTKNI